MSIFMGPVTELWNRLWVKRRKYTLLYGMLTSLFSPKGRHKLAEMPRRERTALLQTVLLSWMLFFSPFVSCSLTGFIQPEALPAPLASILRFDRTKGRRVQLIDGCLFPTKICDRTVQRLAPDPGLPKCLPFPPFLSGSLEWPSTSRPSVPRQLNASW